MAQRVREFDWSRTPLGALEGWPQSLRTLVDLLISQPIPMIILWGPDLTQIYNDAYAVIAATKHPAALGQANRECWPEVLAFNEPIYERVLQHGERVLLEDQLIPLDRHGHKTLEDAYFTVSYSPCRDDEGRIGGIFVTVVETTARIAAERERERVRAEEQLRRSETFYRLIQNDPFGVFIVDNDFRLREVSLGAQKPFAHVPRPLVGRDFAEVLRSVWPEPFASEAIARFRHTLDTGEPFASPSTVEQRADIEDVEAYDWRIERITLPDGPFGVVCYFYDLSERQQLEAALRESEAQLRATFEQAAVGIAHVGLDGRWLRVNRRYCEIVGYERDELLTKTFQDITHADDLDADVSQVQRLLKGEIDRYSMEKRYVRRDGSIVWVNLTVSAVRDAGGNASYLIAVGEDITARRLSEEAHRKVEYRFQRLVEYSPQSTQLFYPDGRTRQLNRAFERLFGITLDQLRDYNILRDPELVRLGVMPLMERAFAGEAVTIEPIPYIPDRGEYAGQTRWAGAYVYPVKDEGGRIEEVVLVHNDVTEHRQAEEEVRRSQIQLKAVIDNAPSAIFIKDVHGRYLLVNAPFGRTAGVSPDSMPGKTDSDVFGPEVAAQFANEDEQVAKSGQPMTFEESFEFKGEYLSFFTNKFPLRDEAGEVYAVCGIATDVTALKRAEALVRESEQRLRLGLRAGKTGTWDWDITSNRVVWSEQLYEFHGLRPDEFGGTSEDFAKLVHPEDSERVWALIQGALNDGNTYEVEFRTVRPSGEVRWLFTTGQVIRDAEGTPARMMGATIDTTDRKESEERLRTSERRFRDMADTAPAMLWVTEPDGYCSFLSRGWYEFTGQTEEEALGVGWADAAHPDDRAAARDAFLNASRDRTPYETDFRLRRFDGEYRWVIDAGRPRFGADGEFLGFIGSVIDITERKLAEEAHERLLDSERAARAEAERASRMKDEFLATLSHELRTPLNAILGWATILKRGDGDLNADDLSQGLDTIERNARAQTQIIEDLLDMSRIISGKVRLDVQRVSLEPVLRAAVDTVMPAAEVKGIRIQAVLDPLAGPVSGDPNRLQQVFWNLLNNAIKFTSRGGRVQVLLERVNSHLEVSVIDTGEGIAPEFLPYVFDRFRQADGSTTRRHGGLGLGLAIVKQLVELHGGTVRAKSAGVGHGSTFTVALPLTVIHPEPKPESERRHPQAFDAKVLDEACIQLDGVRVMVVDDEPDARGLLRRVLEDCRAVVTLAGSATEAFARFAVDRPDVLISDIGMPGEDGYSLIGRLRALPPESGGNVPALALTAYARSEDRTRSVLAGFQMHMSKPVEPAELLAVVASLAGRTGRTT